MLWEWHSFHECHRGTHCLREQDVRHTRMAGPLTNGQWRVPRVPGLQDGHGRRRRWRASPSRADREHDLTERVRRLGHDLRLQHRGHERLQRGAGARGRAGHARPGGGAPRRWHGTTGARRARGAVRGRAVDGMGRHRGPGRGQHRRRRGRTPLDETTAIEQTGVLGRTRSRDADFGLNIC